MKEVIKVIKKSDKVKFGKILIIALSVLFLATAVCTVFLGVRIYRDKKAMEQMDIEISRGGDYSSMLDEKNSENASLQEAKSSEAESYEKKISDENSQHQSKVDELNKKISDLNKQIALKKEKEKTTSSVPAAPTVLPQIPQPPAAPNGKVVYLTFDDGPSPNTPAILDILDRYGVKATFFVINGRYNQYMKDIVNRGHQIALHSYSHDYSKIYVSEDAYFADLQKISDVVKAQTGVESKIVRFPGGSSNTISKKYCAGIMSKLTKSLPAKGYVYFDWNCSNGDATGKKNTVDTQLQYCSQYPKSATNIVVLMHDTGSKKVTVDSLPKIIEYYRNCGMSFDILTQFTPPVHHSVAN